MCIPQQIVLALSLVLTATNLSVSSACPPVSASADIKKPHRRSGARSHDELAARLATALKKDDGDAIRALFAPSALWEPHDVFTTQRDRRRYETVRKHAPSIASALRKYLAAEKLLSFHNKKVQPLIEVGKPDRTKGGTLRTSTGIFLLNPDGTVYVELADQAVAINGRWFVTRLFTDERKFAKYLPVEVARELNLRQETD